MPSRDLKDLSADMQPRAGNFMLLCATDEWLTNTGITVLITCTYRSNKEQEALYAQGRTKPGRIVTRARGGQSKHNCKGPMGEQAAEAFDVVPLRYGKPIWGTTGAGIDDDPSDDDADDLEAWQRIGEIGRSEERRVGKEGRSRWS